MGKWVVVLVMMVGVLATFGINPVVAKSHHHHLHKKLQKHHQEIFDLEGDDLENAIASIPERPPKESLTPETVLVPASLLDAKQELLKKNEIIQGLKSKINSVEFANQFTEGASRFIDSQQILYETFAALRLPLEGTVIRTEAAADEIEIWIDKQQATSFCLWNKLSASCKDSFSLTADEPTADDLNGLIPIAKEKMLDDTECKSPTSLIYVQKTVPQQKERGMLCLNLGEKVINARYWAPQIHSVLLYEFKNEQIPQVRAEVLQDYIHALRAYQQSSQNPIDPKTVDLVTFLKSLTYKMKDFSTSTPYLDFASKHGSDNTATLGTSVKLFVLQEAAQQGLVPWNVVERYLPQRADGEPGFLIFSPLKTGHDGPANRVVKNRKHKFAIRAHLGTITD